MNCKSCGSFLPNESRFCPSCGAKVVTDRLSANSLWTEFVGPFFNWDNFFWKTLVDLIKQPEAVLRAYTSGARKKYFHPFSFLLVYGTLTVLYYKLFPIDITADDFGSSSSDPELGKNSLQFMETYIANYNFFLIGTIPVFAAMGSIVFKKFKDNITEHFVYNCYIQAFVGFLGLFCQIIAWDILHLGMNTFFIVSTIISLAYGTYAFKSLYNLSLKSILWYLFLFLLLSVGLFVLISFLIGIGIGISKAI